MSVSRWWLRLPATIVVPMLTVAACGDGDVDTGGDGDGEAQTLTVFAAASLTDAFAEIGDAFSATRPEVSVELNFGPSSGLAMQLIEGAPADVYASADQVNMDKAVTGEVVEQAPVVFARNVLAIAVPAGNPGGVEGLADLAREELLIGLCAEEVPCGRFARQLLAEAGVTAAPDTNETDVRSLLTKIEADELDAGLVYRSDVLAADERVEGIDIAEADRVVATYPIAPVAASAVPALGEEFVDFVVSEEGRRILVDHGFLAP